MMSASVDILWFEGIAPERLGSLPTVQAMLARGVDARLTPLPLADATNCYFQTLTGLGSGKTGRFDVVRPVGYRARAETETPEGVWRRLLPDVVRAGGRTATLVETPAAEALEALAGADAECVTARLRAAGESDDATLDAIVHHSVEHADHVIVLTDCWAPAPRRLVNVNNFLAEVGFLDCEPDPRPGRAVRWMETLAYGLGAGQVWLNLRGREPQGVVMPGSEADEVRATLIDLLLNQWRDSETGAAVVARALTKDEAYVGEHIFKAPDLVLVFHEGYVPSSRAQALELDEASILPGQLDAFDPDSSPAARLIGAGPSLASGARISGRLIDVVPSVLYLLGLPAPRFLDGDALTALFTPAYREQTPVSQTTDDATALSADDEDIIVGRLQALGYIG
jgi:hypothetical protein